MKINFQKIMLGALAAAALIAVAPRALAQPTTLLAANPTNAWQGYMNVFFTPADGGAYAFGSAWGTPDLRAFFVDNTLGSNNFLTLTPNTNVYDPTNTYWVNPDGSGDKTMDASYYVQDDTLALQSQLLIFNGTCLTNSLTNTYTSTVFVKEFDANYNLVNTTTAALTPGQPFSVFTSTTGGAGHHIQYGFETIGLDASPAALASLGQVTIAAAAADPSLSPIASQAVVQGQKATFTVHASGTGPFTYQWSAGDSMGNGISPLSDGNGILGATSNVLTISNVIQSQAGVYTVSVMNSNSTTSIGSAALTVSSLGSVTTNVLLDASFENNAFAATPDAGWVGFNGYRDVSTNATYYATNTLVTSIDGAYVLQTFSGGANSYNGVYQERPCSPGDVFTGYAWLLTPPSDHIGGAGQAWLEIQFKNAGGTLLSYYKSSLIDSNTPAGVWIKVQPTNHLGTDFATPLGTSPVLVAPPGATIVHFQINNHADTGGSVYADATSLRLREPATALTVTNNTAAVNFATIFGPTYEVLYKTNLVTDPSWHVLSSVFGDGTAQSIADTTGKGRFYIVNTQ